MIAVLILAVFAAFAVGLVVGGLLGAAGEADRAVEHIGRRRECRRSL